MRTGVKREDFQDGYLGDHAYYLDQAAATGDGSWLTKANDLLRSGIIGYIRGGYWLDSDRRIPVDL